MASPWAHASESRFVRSDAPPRGRSACDTLPHPALADTHLRATDYTGMLSSGLAFDTSRTRDRPLTCVPAEGGLIRAWLEAVPTMRVGERANLYIAPEYGYGAQGAAPAIGPHAFLLFDMECVAVEP